MLSSKNKQELKRIAHQEEILKINIGKDLLDDKVIQSLLNSFSTRELVKVSFLKSALEQGDKNEMIENLASKLDSEVVQIIGNTAIFYKENKKLQNHIKLSK